MKSLQWNVVLAALAAVFLATLMFGWPRNLDEAGGFASFVATILTPVSLLLLVITMERQEASQRQATQDGFLALQVQALISLIEDDRAKLDGMTQKYRATGEKSPYFAPVRQRYEKRVGKLNELLATELKLPALVQDESEHV